MTKLTKQNIITDLQNISSMYNSNYNNYRNDRISKEDFIDMMIQCADYMGAVVDDVVDYLKTHRCYKIKEK